MACMPGELTATGTMLAGRGLHVRHQAPSQPILVMIAPLSIYSGEKPQRERSSVLRAIILLQMVPPSGQAKGMAAQCWGKVATRNNLAFHHSTACPAAQTDPQEQVSTALTLAHIACI